QRTRCARRASAPGGTRDVRGECRVSWRGDAQPLSIPDVEALDVKLNGLLVSVRRGNALHHELLLRDARVAGIALVPVGWTTPESRRSVVRQTAIIELASDQETTSFGFHRWPPRCRR